MLKAFASGGSITSSPSRDMHWPTPGRLASAKYIVRRAVQVPGGRLQNASLLRLAGSTFLRAESAKRIPLRSCGYHQRAVKVVVLWRVGLVDIFTCAFCSIQASKMHIGVLIILNKLPPCSFFMWLNYLMDIEVRQAPPSALRSGPRDV